ncbi:MAG: TonB-dependent receptor, partial [Gammaproteobacteria bacterium]|nr:TonB-dependent receptor [Gammaproteobacteria bacterium]
VNAKVSYMLDDHKGWVVNPGQGSDTNDFWSRDNEAVRIAINMDDGGPFSISYSYDDAQITSTAPYFQAIDAGEARFQETARSGLSIPESQVDIQHHNQTTVISGSKAALTSTVGYRELDSREYSNFDGLFGSQVTPTTSGGDRIEQDQFSIDLRLAGIARDGELDYIVGAQNQRENVELTEASNSGSASVESFAVYAQGVLGLNERLDLTLGWRATRDEKTVESLQRDGQTTGDQTKIDDDNTAYEVMLAYQLSEKLRSWLSLATGFKAAGASLYADNTNPYDAETSETIELGFAGTIREDKLDYSIVGFVSEIDDRQVVFHDPDNLRFTDIVNDRGSNQVDGFELEMAIRPLQALQISATYSYLDTDSNPLAEPYAQAGTEFNFMPGAGPATLARIERAPRHSGSLEVDYNFARFEAGDLGLHVEYLANSGYFFNPLNNATDARDVVNVRVNMSKLMLEQDSGELAVSVWARNVLDDKYAVASQYVSEDSFRASQSGQVVSAFGEPATYGVDIRYMF